MKLYWTNACKENNFSCPRCQLSLGSKSGQMPKISKNHKIQMIDGQVRCVACNTTVGYFPSKSKIDGEKIKCGFLSKTLDRNTHLIAVEQEEFN